jgi:hypothetical protein
MTARRTFRWFGGCCVLVFFSLVALCVVSWWCACAVAVGLFGVVEMAPLVSWVC